jgi:hypothetical protein
LCQAIVGPSKLRGHLSERMCIAAVRHTKMAEQFTMLWAAVSSTVESVLRRLPTGAFWVDVVDELVTEFWKQEERCSHLEKSGVMVCDLILGLPSSQADRLEEVMRQL